MESALKRWAFWVVVFLLTLILLPVVSASVALLLGSLNGSVFPGNMLLTLIEISDGPTAILQGLFTVIFGLIGMATLWHEDTKYAAILILLCLAGIVLTCIMWIHLSNPDAAADLWQEASGPLNGETFPPALHAYMKSLLIGLGADLIGIFGLKGVEKWW
jgi:hypothetical protein